MLEGALEQVLLQYLAPYVDGISKDKLHLGVFSGSLELKDLRVKAEALALLGWEGFRVRNGTIKVIKLSIPWSKLYTGKLRASVEHVHLEVESLSESTLSEDELVAEMRKTKEKAIEVRMDQLRERLDAAEGEGDGAQKKSYGVKLTRKIINNITIALSNVSLSFINSRKGLALGLEFPSLDVLSTDKHFKECSAKEEVDNASTSMYKLLRLQDLGIRMSPAGSASLADAKHMLSPISASLRLTHVPAESVLTVRLDVATEHLANIKLQRSQVKLLRRLQAEMAAEVERLFAKLVSPEDARKLYQNHDKTMSEYGHIYERVLLQKLGLAHSEDGAVTAAERQQKGLIEDAFSVRLLARERWRVHRKVEALNEEVARRQREAEAARRAEERSKAGWFSRMRMGRAADASPASSPEGADRAKWVSEEEQRQLLQDIEDESKVESVDLPQSFNFEFLLGKMALDLVDDRRADERHMQLLNLELEEAKWDVNAAMATDHRGQDSLEWRTEIRVRNFRARHALQTLFKFNTEEATTQQRERGGAAEGASAARLEIESKLEPQQNLLRLGFEFMPVEIHTLPGIVEELTDFVRAPNLADIAVAAALDKQKQFDVEERMEERMEMAKQLLEANELNAKEVAQKVYDRIPDKFFLEVRISSPIVHVPVEGLGSAVFSLGNLSILTPQACEYQSINLEMDLNHTTLRTISLKNEHFDMIQPVPVHLNVDYRGSDEQNAVNVGMKVKEMALSLSPQALQILLCTPGAMAAVLDPIEADEPGAAGPQVPQPARDAWASEAAAAAMERVPSGQRRSTMAIYEQVMGAEGQDLLQRVQRKAEEVRSKQFLLDLALEFDALDVTLADSIVPIMRYRMEFLAPGLVMHKQKEPNFLTVNIDKGTMEVEVLNPRHGAWEPLMERCHLKLEVERRALNEESTATHVILTGHEPVLFNFTPTAVRRASWIMPQFVDSLTIPGPASGAEASQSSPAAAASGARSGVKYRVVNLCDRGLELVFRSRHKDNLLASVEPTGSKWESLDEWVLPHFATAVVARVPGGNPSEALSLERAGAVTVPGSGYVAELLTFSPSHRVLLLATPLRVRNQTDLPLTIRFHNGASGEVLPLSLPETTSCDAALIGHEPPTCRVASPYSDLVRGRGSEAQESTLELPPNACCSVPPAALFRRNQEAVSTSRTLLSARPAGLDMDFCAVLEAGDGAESSTGRCGGLHLTCESHRFHYPLPVPTVVTTIVLRPPLVVLNALPIGDLTFQYTELAQAYEGRWQQAKLAKVPCFTRWNVYDFPAVRREGIAVKARLEDQGPWSEPAVFRREAFRGEADDAAQTLQLQQRHDGAAAGVTVEPLSGFEMRLSCPTWFVDRCGLDRPITIQLRHKDRLLPKRDGITLLPSECMEEECELVMQSNGVATAHEMRMPPSYTVFPWRTHCGDFIFCMQAEDVAASDVLGAQCQVMTVRPRLVFTNSSPCELELQLTQSRVLRLEPGQSSEYHWRPQQGEGDTPTCTLRFRPLRSPPCPWSSLVVCGDATAGSTAMLLQSVEGTGANTASPDIWSVDVAPVKGALAVSFRQGSEFAAKNSVSSREDVSMHLRPSGCSDVVADIPVPVGKEVPYGWPRPFNDWSPSTAREAKKDSGAGRTVEVIITQRSGSERQRPRMVRMRIDPSRTAQHVLRGLDLALVVTRVGLKTLLSLVEHSGRSGSPSGSLAGPAASTSSGSSFQVDVRLSRLGVSIVEEYPRPRELLYMQLELIRLEFKKDGDAQSLKLAASEAQVECQLPDRVDSGNPLAQKNDALVRLHQERPAVILANCADGDRAFLTVVMSRGATSSRDTVIPFMDVEFDAVDVTVDDKWLEPFVGWCRQLGDDVQGGGVSLQSIRDSAGKPIADGYAVPPLPSVVQVDQMQISQLCFTVWCALKLKNVHFLPAYVRTALRVLSFSGQFTLDGATLRLEEQKLPPHRGSLADFLRGLSSEYTSNLLQNVAGLLGKSSVLNLPRVPFRIGMAGVSYISDTFGIAAAEAASLVNRLTFDDEYVARQRQLRNDKKIQNVGDGMIEAGKSLAQGVEGLFDVVKKPIEGAAKDGVGGFFTGMGKGLVGTFVKPISKVGQAVSDVTQGIAAQVTPDTQSSKRRRARPRMRHPRLLFTQLGVLRPWSEFDSQLLLQLGEELTFGVEEVVPLTPENSGCNMLVLLLFRTRLVLAQLKAPGGRLQDEGRRRYDGGSDSSSSGAALPRGSSNVSTSSEPTDFLMDLDESGRRLFSQFLKPLNTVVQGAHDFEREITGQATAASHSVRREQRRAIRKELCFRDLTNVNLSPGHDMLQFEDHQKHLFFSLPLQASPIEHPAREALASGFRSAAENPLSIANWDALKSAMHEERRRRRDETCGQSAQQQQRRGAGTRILEVFEVERRDFTMQWRTPYMPQDQEMSWRWLDRTGCKHPQLDKRLRKDQVVAMREPPCVLDGTLFKPKSGWVCDVNARTDRKGWQYGMAWNSSTWEVQPGIVDGIRRRRWTKTYE